MKTITFERGMMIINEQGKPAVMERVGTSLSAEEVAALLEKHNFKDNDAQSDHQ